jgi:hypothetical protein
VDTSRQVCPSKKKLTDLSNMTSIPTDSALYEKAKKSVFDKNPVNSAYRSGAVVRKYKSEFAKKHGDTKQPYQTGSRTSVAKKDTNLTRWFKEDWQNQRGGLGYKSASDIYRPTKKISAKTPKTFKELSPAQIATARKKKATTGRVDKY